ncbi:MAG: FtsX-like permease family protein [Candidatus Protistobacter heckmanni]|nr:FtsX-like permease family protein [Candidatus Protistobacter heckmanni]
MKLAWRNLWRNRRRSLVTILSLAFGFCAVALFAGHTKAIYSGLSNSAIHAELIGHLTVNKRGWLTEGKLHPGKYMLTADEIAKIQAVVAQAIPGARVMPRMSASGLISNGRTSTIFIASGIAPADMAALRGPFRDAPGGLSEARPQGVTIGQGLADILGFHTGDNASVLASTIHGQANAADVDIGATVNTGNIATNDKLMTMPLELARSVMDANGRAELLTILLPAATVGMDLGAGATRNERLRSRFSHEAPGERVTGGLRDTLNAALKQAGLDMEVRTWQEMSAFYRQVKSMYDMIFALMLAVVLAIVVLSIANAMSMAVVERTREIGTLRAIGVRRGGISRMFVGEALMLVIVGTAAGLALTALVRFGVNAADIQYVPPANTVSVPLYIAFDSGKTFVAAVVLAVLAVGAAFIPARRAARHPIIESLGHV